MGQSTRYATRRLCEWRSAMALEGMQRVKRGGVMARLTHSKYFVGEEAHPEHADGQAADEGEETHCSSIEVGRVPERVEDNQGQPYHGQRGGQTQLGRLCV